MTPSTLIPGPDGCLSCTSASTCSACETPLLLGGGQCTLTEAPGIFSASHDQWPCNRNWFIGGTYHIQLVGGLEHVLFLHILGIIIPTDFHIFRRGRAQPPTICWAYFSGLDFSQDQKIWPEIWYVYVPTLGSWNCHPAMGVPSLPRTSPSAKLVEIARRTKRWGWNNSRSGVWN